MALSDSVSRWAVHEACCHPFLPLSLKSKSRKSCWQLLQRMACVCDYKQQLWPQCQQARVQSVEVLQNQSKHRVWRLVPGAAEDAPRTGLEDAIGSTVGR